MKQPTSDFSTRFAPSPTGYLHLGHAAAALAVRGAADAAEGEALLRIEDIDPTRCRPEYTQAIFEDLDWLSIRFDGEVRVQSDHFDDYHRALESLIARGLAYRCFLSRAQVEADIARAPHGLPAYLGPSVPLSEDEEIERIEAGQPFSWRLSLAAAQAELGPEWERLGFIEGGGGPQGGRGWVRARPERLGDIILARKDAPVAYHLACTHDDALQGISHVVRGVDLFESTHVHVLLQALMGWPQPVYRHHPLKTDSQGRRLAKRDATITLRALRGAGMTPQDVLSAARL